MSDHPPAPPAAPPAAGQPAGPTGFDDAAAIQSRIVIRPAPEQEFLQVNVNDLRLRLWKLAAAIERGIRDRDAWKTPTGSAVGFLSALITVAAVGNDFRLLFSRDAWMGVFGLALVLSLGRAGWGVWRAVTHKDATTVEDVITELGSRDIREQVSARPAAR